MTFHRDILVANWTNTLYAWLQLWVAMRASKNCTGLVGFIGSLVDARDYILALIKRGIAYRAV